MRNCIDVEKLGPLSQKLLIVGVKAHIMVEVWRVLQQVFLSLEILLVSHLIEASPEEVKTPFRDLCRQGSIDSRVSFHIVLAFKSECLLVHLLARILRKLDLQSKVSFLQLPSVNEESWDQSHKLTEVALLEVSAIRSLNHILH